MKAEVMCLTSQETSEIAIARSQSPFPVLEACYLPPRVFGMFLLAELSSPPPRGSGTLYSSPRKLT